MKNNPEFWMWTCIGAIIALMWYTYAEAGGGLPEQRIIVEQPDNWMYWLVGAVVVPVGLALFNWWKGK